MDKDEIWNKTLVLLLEDTDEEDPKTVFLNLLTPVGVFGDQFVLLAESTPVESWVRKNYLTEIQDKLLQVMGTPVSVGLGVSTQKEAPQQTTPAPVETVQQPEPDWMNQFVDPQAFPATLHRRTWPPPRKRSASGENTPHLPRAATRHSSRNARSTPS